MKNERLDFWRFEDVARSKTTGGAHTLLTDIIFVLCVGVRKA